MRRLTRHERLAITAVACYLILGLVWAVTAAGPSDVAPVIERHTAERQIRYP